MIPNFLSATQVSMYLRCPLQYFYRYVRGIRIQPSGAITLGGSIHDTFKENYSQKMTTHSDMPIPHLQEFFATRFEVKSVVTEWTKEEKPGQFKDAGIEMVRMYQSIVAPTVQPLQVEQRWEVSVQDLEKNLLIIVDLIDSEHRIKDYKVASKTPPQSIVQESLQLSLYSLGYRLATGKTETSIGLDYLIRNKKNDVSINRLEGSRSVQQLDRAVKMLKKVSQAVQNEVFYPCNPELWQCSEKWCGFYHLCHKEW